MSDRSERAAWAAGFIDGEGCIGIYRFKAELAYRPWVGVVQVDRRPLDVLRSMFGGSIVRDRHKSEKRRTIWSWRLLAIEDVRRMLSEIEGHLVEKQEQAQFVLDFIGSRGRPPFGPWERAEQQAAAEALSQFKREAHRE